MEDQAQPTHETRHMNCSLCKQAIDATGLEPGTLIQCPHCSGEINSTWNMGNYILTRKLGQGGMGTVYEATDRVLGRVVAVKVLKEDLTSDVEFIKSFAKEAQITASINHPNVVQVYQFAQEGETYYLAAELLKNGSWDDQMNQVGAMPEVDALQVCLDAARGLREAFMHGLLHRDVKPGNILYGANREGKVVDFGLALSLEEAASQLGDVWGTPYYVAPEKLDQSGEDHRSDIYSLGATLFHAIAGRPPFDASNASIVAWKHLKSQKVSLKAFAPHVTDETAHTVNKCLERNPSDRFQSYDEFISSLEYARKCATGVSKSRGPIMSPLNFSKQHRIFSMRTYVAIGLAALIVGGVSWKFRREIKSFLSGAAISSETRDEATPIPPLIAAKILKKASEQEKQQFQKAWNSAVRNKALISSVEKCLALNEDLLKAPKDTALQLQYKKEIASCLSLIGDEIVKKDPSLAGLFAGLKNTKKTEP